jgi:hypothetical protein
MANNNVGGRKLGEQTEHGQGIKFETLYDNDYVVGNKLTDEKRAELNKNAAEINEACVPISDHLIRILKRVGMLILYQLL